MTPTRRLPGFTLIEVMVALVIVSLALAGVAASMGQMIDPLQVLIARYQMTDLQYQFIQADVQWPQLVRSLGTQDQIFRLTVKGTLGEMTRRVTAVLKQDGAVVRTLYYREE